MAYPIRYASELPRKSSPGIQPLQASNVVENLKYTLKLPSALWDEAILGLKVDPQVRKRKLLKRVSFFHNGMYVDQIIKAI